MDRSIRLALHAAAEALDGQWPEELLRDPQTALFVGTSKGPICSWLKASQQLRDSQALDATTAQLIAGGVGSIAGELHHHLGMRGPTHTSVAACASGLFALHRAAKAITCGECERALVVASDASLHPLFEAGFARLGVLAKVETDGRRHCRPFDPQGRGFFVSEGAAALLLEPASSDHAGTVLERIWIGADGTHLLSIDPHTEALRYGLSQMAADGPVDFIHAHATGTAHDQQELQAIRATLGDRPHIFSTKGSLGHTLGAAGLISLVLSIRAHQTGCTPDGHAIAAGGRSLTIAQGFGGHIALAVLRS